MKKLLILLPVLILLIVAPCAAEQAAPEITIFHTNDVHGRYDSSDGIGYAMVADFVRDAREGGENVLLLDAGDAFHGTVFANMLRGEGIVEIMNAMGYDAMAVGNHDFNYGYDRLKELEELASFPLLSSNILKEDGSHAFTPYTVVTVGDTHVGIVGAQNPEMRIEIHPDHTEGLIFAGIEEVIKAVEAARAESDVIIILAHWGCDGEFSYNSQAALATIDGVSLVIDGHTHTPLDEIVQAEGGAFITSTGEYLQSLGRVSLRPGADQPVSAALIPRPEHYEDHDILDVVTALEAEQSDALDRVIGQTAVELNGERDLVRTRESNWGSYVCDAMVEMTGADVALMNGGNIRATVPEGDITVRDVLTVFPYSNYVCVLSVTGETLIEALEHGYSSLPDGNGAFLQMGGMTVTIDASKEPGERVPEVMIGGEPIDPLREYDLATNDFLMTGGDGFTMLADCPLLLKTIYMDELITEAIERDGVIAPEADGRIRIIGLEAE